ncbi:hypothetical protein AMECASPLE_035234 [Ameca splendens]|uniref:Uncharacterized protein n=1 Tax=Ameca splendens TaxID=208324 RepID=A0ABV0ZTF3_9TELE
MSWKGSRRRRRTSSFFLFEWGNKILRKRPQTSSGILDWPSVRKDKSNMSLQPYGKAVHSNNRRNIIPNLRHSASYSEGGKLQLSTITRLGRPLDNPPSILFHTQQFHPRNQQTSTWEQRRASAACSSPFSLG